jgi:triacylglycerol lipase
MNQLQPKAIGFNLSNAYALVQAAGGAYQDADTMQTRAKAWGFGQFRFLDSGTTQGYVMANDQAIVIAFRGTEGKNRKDWITNLNFDHVEIPDGQVHEGFNSAINCIWEDLLLTVVKFRTQAQPVLLTGHSLGGALATLATLRLIHAGQSVQGLYTFGSPRVGDRTYMDHFNAAMNDRAFRFVNDEDIVAKLPFKAIGYCHVGEKCRFNTDGQLCRQPLSRDGLIEQIKAEVEDLLEPNWEVVQDHDLGAYQDAILANLLTTPRPLTPVALEA